MDEIEEKNKNSYVLEFQYKTYKFDDLENLLDNYEYGKITL